MPFVAMRYFLHDVLACCYTEGHGGGTEGHGDKRGIFTMI